MLRTLLKTVKTYKRRPIVVTKGAVAYRTLVKDSFAFLKRPDSSSPNYILSQGRAHNLFSSPFGPYWHAIRRNLTSEILHPSRLAQFGPARRLALSRLISDLRSQQGSVAAVGESIGMAVFSLVFFICFGLAADEGVIRNTASISYEVRDAFPSLMALAQLPAWQLTRFVFRKRWNLLLSIRRRQHAMYMSLIDERLRPPGEGGSTGCFSFRSYVESLVNLRLRTDGKRPLTDNELVGLCSEFLGGGSNGTTSALQWIMANIVAHPELQRRLHDEIKEVLGKTASNSRHVEEADLRHMPLLRAVVMEGLRLHPPVPFLPREMVHDTPVDGEVSAPSGSTVLFLVEKINRDKAVWTKPMEFRPERFLRGGWTKPRCSACRAAAARSRC